MVSWIWITCLPGGACCVEFNNVTAQENSGNIETDVEGFGRVVAGGRLLGGAELDVAAREGEL